MHPTPLQRQAGTCGYISVGLVCLGRSGEVRRGIQHLSVMAQHEKNSLSPTRWHLQVSGAESFWRRRWLALGEGRKLRVTLTHRSARLIAGRCRRFITATRARRGCGSFCPGNRGEEGPAGTRALPVEPPCPCEGEAMVDISPQQPQASAQAPQGAGGPGSAS